MKIVIIGAGWYGCHLALVLRELGHDVTIYEKNKTIFKGISGEFGIRLHSGSHYPRSPETRINCRNGFEEFIKRYPELVVDHSHSIYGLGISDSTGKASHVDELTFKEACEEFPSTKAISPKEHGYSNLLSAFDMKEPSIRLGKPLRDFFKTRLKRAGVKIQCNTLVDTIDSSDNHVTLTINGEKLQFDKLINATSYQSLLPTEAPPPFPFEVVYQPCLGLVYEDLEPKSKEPFSFIVMDALYPCMMPLLGEEKDHYLLTHAQFTILASCKTPEEAEVILGKINDEYIQSKIQPRSEHEMNRFWPEFKERFKFIGWKGTVLAKLKTKTEFRSAVTFEKDNLIHIIPGKVSDIFKVEQEIVKHLLRENVLTHNGYHYIQDGVLAHGFLEIITPPEDSRATTTLQTFAELNENTPSSVINYSS